MKKQWGFPWLHSCTGTFQNSYCRFGERSTYPQDKGKDKYYYYICFLWKLYSNHLTEAHQPKKQTFHEKRETYYYNCQTNSYS